MLIQTEDFNITEPLVRATYNLPQTAVKVLSQSERSALTPHTTFLRESEGLMTHAGTCTSFIGGMQAAAQAAESEASACLVQKVSVFAGIALALVLGFAMGLPGLSLAALVLYQLCLLYTSLSISVAFTSMFLYLPKITAVRPHGSFASL